MKGAVEEEKSEQEKWKRIRQNKSKQRSNEEK